MSLTEHELEILIKPLLALSIRELFQNNVLVSLGYFLTKTQIIWLQKGQKPVQACGIS